MGTRTISRRVRWLAGLLALAGLGAAMLTGPGSPPAGAACLSVVRSYEPALQRGLTRGEDGFTLDELDALDSLRKARPITAVTCFSPSMRVRWHSDAALIGMDLSEVERRTGHHEAVRMALAARGPVLMPYNDDFDQFAVPLYAHSELRGLILLSVVRGACGKV